MKSKILIIAASIVVVGGLWLVLKEPVSAPTPLPSGEDALDVVPPADTIPVEGSIDQAVSVFSTKLTPLEVVEDSRCPSDVQCIQAGTVRLRVKLESAMGNSEQIMTLNTPITTEAEEITLMQVLPNPVAGTAFLPSDYRFTFWVKKR